MTQIIKIIVIEDDDEEIKVLDHFFRGLNNEAREIKLIMHVERNFDNGMKKIKRDLFDILILDWHDEKENPKGKEIMKEVVNKAYLPIIVFSGFFNEIDFAEINIEKNFFCRIIDKNANGYENLKESLNEIVKSDLFLFKQDVESTILTFLKNFWKYFCENWLELQRDYGIDDLKLIILTKLSFALSREKFKNSGIHENVQGHPLNFYIFPHFTPENYDFEAGDVLSSKNTGESNMYIILTPNCDFANHKADNVLIAKIIPIKKKYDEEVVKKGSDKLMKTFIKETKTMPRYFFLPGTPFIPHSFVDFQYLEHTNIENIKKNYEKVTNLSYPFAQSLTSAFVSYYNRIGFEDFNWELILNDIEEKKE